MHTNFTPKQKHAWLLKNILEFKGHLFKAAALFLTKVQGLSFSPGHGSNTKEFLHCTRPPWLHKINKYSCVPARAGLHSAREHRQHVHNARRVCRASGAYYVQGIGKGFMEIKVAQSFTSSRF